MIEAKVTKVECTLRQDRGDITHRNYRVQFEFRSNGFTGVLDARVNSEVGVWATEHFGKTVMFKEPLVEGVHKMPEVGDE